MVCDLQIHLCIESVLSFNSHKRGVMHIPFLDKPRWRFCCEISELRVFSASQVGIYLTTLKFSYNSQISLTSLKFNLFQLEQLARVWNARGKNDVRRCGVWQQYAFARASFINYHLSTKYLPIHPSLFPSIFIWCS